MELRKEEAIKKLELCKETLSLSLKKNGVEQLVPRVGLVIDQSGSMLPLYRNEIVQDVVERILPIAIQFDDNQELDIWIFSDKYKRLPPATPNDFFDYVNRNIFECHDHQLWGGTYYAPVLRDILRKYTSEEPSSIPSFVVFITDGECFDEKETEKVLQEASRCNLFFQFVEIGDERFRFLERFDELSGRVIDNANFFQVNSISDISDKELYDLLLQEYPKWEKQARQLGIDL